MQTKQWIAAALLACTCSMAISETSEIRTWETGHGGKISAWLQGYTNGLATVKSGRVTHILKASTLSESDRQYLSDKNGKQYQPPESEVLKEQEKQKTRTASLADSRAAPVKHSVVSVDFENSAWDGSVRQVTDYLRKNLNDYDSYKSVKWYKVVKNDDGGAMVRHTFRAKNAYGGVILQDLSFVMDSEGTVLRAVPFPSME